MGLDFSHTDAHWSYHGFKRFRTALAAHEGIALDRMDGFRSYGDDRPSIPWTGITSDLAPLLNHSDCDGELTPEECRRITPRLREVVANLWKPGDYDYATGMELADGMDAAAAAGEPFEFC